MKRKDFDLNEIFTYNNLYESYKSVCKSCRSKFKKTLVLCQIVLVDNNF